MLFPSHAALTIKYDSEIQLCLYYGKIIASLLKNYIDNILRPNCDGCVKSSKKARNLAFQIKQYFKNNFQNTNHYSCFIAEEN